MLDIFKSDAFGVVPLTDAINKIPFVPGRIGSLGLFNEGGVATTSVAIEERAGILKLVGPTPRGAPGHTMDKGKRTLRVLGIPHFEINDGIMAEEVQGIRAFGSETDVEVLMEKVAERGRLASQNLEVAQEYSRIGAIKGIVTYAADPQGDTPTALNLFTEFGVSQESEVDFDLDNATPAAGALRGKCATVYRLVADNLEGIPFSGLHAFCGNTLYDNLIAHVEVRNTYLASAEAAELRSGYLAGGQSYGAFNFGGIMWENYRGAVEGTSFVHTDKCHIFPVGVPGLFRTYYGPGDWIETVNTVGRRLYARQDEMPNGKGINLDTQMNSLNICTRPKVLILGKRTEGGTAAPMGAIDDALTDLFGDVNLGRAATFNGTGGVTRAIRVIPLGSPPELDGGMVLAAMTNEGRSFLVRRAEFAGADPRTGDTLVVDGATWRIRIARPRTAVADLWALDCQPV